MDGGFHVQRPAVNVSGWIGRRGQALEAERGVKKGVAVTGTQLWLDGSAIRLGCIGALNTKLRSLAFKF